jgi:membrane protein DedA with SNARE-associated domain
MTAHDDVWYTVHMLSSSLIIALFLKYRYAIFIPLAIFEGTTVALIAGVLFAMGILDLVITYIILIIGDIIPDTLWYQIGRHAHRRDLIRRFGHHIGMTPERLDFLEYLWRRHPMTTIALSKLAYGISAPMLMTAGHARVPLKLYYGTAIPVSTIQYGIIMLIGMGAYRSYETAFPYIRDAGMLAAVMMVGVLVGTWYASRAARDKLLDSRRS